MRASASLLLVDDSFALRERLARAFRDRGFVIRTAANYDEGMSAVREEPPDMAVVDLKMPGKSGLELLRDIKQHAAALGVPVRVLVLTGFGSIATTVDALRLGAVNFLPKPADA